MAAKNKQLDKREAVTVAQAERTRSGSVYIPAVDIIDKEDDLILIADMPGTDEKSIDITLEQNILTISGNIEPLNFPGYQLAYKEYKNGDYQRSFTLTDTIDQEKIEANYKNGVLTVRLAKIEPAKPKKIAVKAG